MSFRADLALYDGNGRLTALADIKNRIGTSRKWAAQMRRDILVHGGHWESDFFLLIIPDRIYVWKDSGTAPVERLPTFEADTEHMFAPYFKRAGIAPHETSGQAFELVVASWLSDPTRSSGSFDERSDEQGWLDASGVRAAMKAGRIEYEALV